jgi:hypothetical protein
MLKLLLLFLLTFNLYPVFSEENNSECDECKKRKSELCSEECLLVDERKAECIASCIGEYCQHKCELGKQEDKAK